MKKKKQQAAFSTPASSAPAAARLRVIKGPHKGVAYKLVAGKVTLGRSSENDIVLINEEKCSRKQAVVTLNPNSTYSIKDLSKKSPLKVNDKVSFQSDLQDGDLIQFGSSVLQFEFKGALPPPGYPAPPMPSPLPPSAGALPPTPLPKKDPDSLELALEEPASAPAPTNPIPQNFSPPPYNPAPAPPPPGFYPPPPSSAAPKKQKRKKLLPKVILGLLVLGFVWLMLQESGQNPEEKEDKLRTLANREENIKTLTELKEKELEKRSKSALSSYKNAQFAYVKGIRDYRKGVYGRAIESFRVCKTIYPQHNLCDSYLKKARLKRQQLIQAWMVAGKDYRQKRRFKACMSSFQNVMTALEQDKRNPNYKEAKESFDICKIQHGDRY